MYIATNLVSYQVTTPSIYMHLRLAFSLNDFFGVKTLNKEVRNLHLQKVHIDLWVGNVVAMEGLLDQL